MHCYRLGNSCATSCSCVCAGCASARGITVIPLPQGVSWSPDYQVNRTDVAWGDRLLTEAEASRLAVLREHDEALAAARAEEREACALLVRAEIESAKNNGDDTKYLRWALKHIEERS